MSEIIDHVAVSSITQMALTVFTDNIFRRNIMLQKIIFISLFAFSITACEQPTNEIIKEADADAVNNISIIWQGMLSVAPENPSIGWVYYDTTQKAAFIWDGDSWEVFVQDGISIIWKGELPSAPSNPKTNWAYHNIIDGNSYIYNGYDWDLLAKAGRDGASGILLWLGTLTQAPINPSSGYAYHNSTMGISYIWDGDSWEVLARDGTDGQDGTNGTNGMGITWKGAVSSSPVNPQLNWAYYNTTDNTSYIWDGDSWEILAESGNATIIVSISWRGSLTAAPVNPQIGWMYYNSVFGKSYIWDGTMWDIISQDGQDGQNGTSPVGYLITWKGGFSSAPSNPQQGWAYYNTSQKKSYIWDGSSWQILAQDGQNGTGGGGSGTYGPWLYVILYTAQGNYTQYNTTLMDTVNFGKVGIGSTARSSTFYIGLIGGESTTLNLTGSPAIQVSGVNSDCFSVIQPSTTSATTGTYIMDANIIFSPNSTGQKTAIITIPNNSPDKPDFSFTVTGTGSLWPKTYDGGEGDGDDQITCSAMDNQGNIYFIGYGFELVNHHSGSDWWIKKIDSTGNEIVSGWNKKIDFYDNYGSSSDTHDRPTNAIIDSNDNLIVSDGYNTIKWSSSGTEQWRKDVGGTLYLDFLNNIFIVTSSSVTKYNSSGVQLWTKPYTGKLAFDNSNNILAYSSDVFRYITSSGTENWTNIAGDIDSSASLTNGWYNSSIEANEIEYWQFPVVKGKSYSVSWNDRNYGDGTKTGRIYVSANYTDDEQSIFSRTGTTNGWSSPKTFTASKTGTVTIRVEPYSSSYYGTYGVAVTDWYNDGASIIDGWYNSYLTTNGSETRVVTVTQGKRYIVAWNSAYAGDGSKTGNIEVSAKWEDDNASIFSNTHDGWTSPKSFLATKSGNIIVTVKTYSSSASYAGTYAVVVKEPSTISGTKINNRVLNSAAFDAIGNVYIAGYGYQLFYTHSKKDVWIKKFDPSGNEITSGWNKKFDWGHSDDEYATKILFDGTNIIVAGQGNDLINGASADDGWVRRFTTSGSEITSFLIPDANATLIKYDGYYYFTGGSSTYNLALRKYNDSGILSVSFNHLSDYVQYPVFTIDSSDNVYVSGEKSDLITPDSNYDWVIRKFNGAGVEQ
jgi:hypothetical protein